MITEGGCGHCELKRGMVRPENSPVPAVVVILQSLEVRVQGERIFRVQNNEIGMPVQTLLSLDCCTYNTPVRLSVPLITIIGIWTNTKILYVGWPDEVSN